MLKEKRWKEGRFKYWFGYLVRRKELARIKRMSPKGSVFKISACPKTLPVDDVKGIFATSDIMALSAVKVIKEQGYKMPVIGADGIIKMNELIKDGTLSGTVAQNPYDMGYISVETAWKVLKGEQFRKSIDTGVDLITKDNAKQKLDFLKELLE